jgi:DNA-directed RNA polymerase II subunit RPB2
MAEARDLARSLLDKYFRTTAYPYTQHHLTSYNQFVQQDLVSCIHAQNPILILKDMLDDKTNTYKYRIELYIGAKPPAVTENDEKKELERPIIEIGTPTVSLQNTQEIRILYPNEARLRNLSYVSSVYTTIYVKIWYIPEKGANPIDISPPENTFERWELFKLPIMLHSNYCMLNNKPSAFLREVGECPYDSGGYFIVDGAEKVLVTRQEQAFNTLYITPQNDPKVAVYASIQCLSAATRQIKRIAFSLQREITLAPLRGPSESKYSTIVVSLPFVRKPVPLFIVFRALGFESDEEILKMIFPDFSNPEAKILLPHLHASILEAYPFLTTYTSIKYIMTLTKGFSEAHVLDIIKNQLFIHMPNDTTSQALFLGDCVRKILRVYQEYDEKTDRDDTRNQRCLTSGFLIQELFNNSYKLWVKAVMLAIGKRYNYNKQQYTNERFQEIFLPQNDKDIFVGGMLHSMVMKGFKGKWGTGLGEDKSGVLQSLSRLSYTDFMSHCRRVILDFDTSMKLTGPRKLHTSQYGYFCTSETPTGSSIGIAKNLSIMTCISTSSQTDKFYKWLYKTGRIYKPQNMTLEERIVFVPVYVNGGMFGYSAKPDLITQVVRLLKRTGCLPYSVSVTFSIRDRKVYIFMDAGRPMRPLIWLSRRQGKDRVPIDKLTTYPTWRDIVLGRLKSRETATLASTDFFDPLEGRDATLEQYPDLLEPHAGAIEYVDPYEQNEAFIANGPVYIRPETTHMEVHPSTIMSMMTSLIPFAPHNQSPRNQLSCSQSKQGLSIYATNWRNRFDNTAHVLCYGEMPLTRTLYNNYLGEGKMAYGMNCILAIACWSGYNQEDGIVMNLDALKRGMFRSMAFRSYEAFEEDDERAGIHVRFGNPANIGQWNDLRSGLDYSKLDENGIIRVGEFVDETTVIVGAYMVGTTGGQLKDASVCPQVWTRGRVEKVAVMYNNAGLRLIKIRVVQDRVPELGDKFCVTEDHEVLTANRGWVPIKEITMKDSVYQRLESGEKEAVRPLDLIELEYNGPMLDIHCCLEEAPLCVSPNHRLFGITEQYNSNTGTNYTPFLKEAEKVSKEYKEIRHYQVNENNRLELITNIVESEVVPEKIYCITVPSSVFMIRRKNMNIGYWTGNSNRHGQKGTIGALLRGYDMPRTESGIVPDMIMNPHAIPSRMTIAQNLEQLFGKSAALTGTIADGTSFMNDGSPQDDIGAILEELGFEKHGNEVMYNGATGEQIPTAIFIGPVYGMRLKHMVEDKWQARGKGRKEVRTHQPTGGRGAQGGLKIGEMDRDAILGHGIAAFVKESYMERSDGMKMPICIACGTIPIYNPKLNLQICAMCDGPVQFIGDTIKNLEIIPPLGRPKSKIVEVEIPYSMKLLTQEQEAYMNLTMRYITTAGIQKLRSHEFIGTPHVDNLGELERIIYPEIVVPAYVEDVEKPSMTLEQLRSMGAVIEEQQAGLDVIQEEEGEDEDNPIISLGQDPQQVQPVIMLPVMMQQQQQPQQQQQQQQQPQQQEQEQEQLPQMMNQVQMQQPQMMNQVQMQQPQMMNQVQMNQVPQMQQPQMMNQVPQMNQVQQPALIGGGSMLVSGGATPLESMRIVVGTAVDDFKRDGIEMDGGSRGLRRASYRTMGGEMNSTFGNASGPVLGPVSGSPIRITKLE